MENNEKIFIEINKKKLNKLDYSLSDILCFVDGLEAAQRESEGKFNTLINATYDLREFRNLIDKHIRSIRNGK